MRPVGRWRSWRAKGAFGMQRLCSAVVPAMAFGLVLTCGGWTICSPIVAFADVVPAEAPVSASATTQYRLGEVRNAGLDDGYTKADEIRQSDPHFGWELGSFYLSDFTRVITADDGSTVFLKNPGDDVWLNFDLVQNIDQVNDNERLFVCDDTNGYDERMAVSKTDFGRGTLIIRRTDYENRIQDPLVYTDFLSAESTVSANTGVKLSEEGDYEVVLDYELQYDVRKIGDASILPEYSDYTVRFSFSIRNGNCMVYPFDVVTGAELSNASFSENGFRLDLANSRYLDIDVKKEVLNEQGDALVADARFNKPARDGEEFTDEGMYTFTVRNRYTGQESTKRIYVGSDDALKAYAANDGMSLADIRSELEAGSEVADDGTLVSLVEKGSDARADEGTELSSAKVGAIAVAVFVALAAVAAAVVLLLRRRKGATAVSAVAQPGASASATDEADARPTADVLAGESMDEAAGEPAGVTPEGEGVDNDAR